MIQPLRIVAICPYCGAPVSATTESAVLDVVVEHVAFAHPEKCHKSVERGTSQ